MYTRDLVVRCYAEREDGYWQAFCLDYCLAAQADTFEEARQKLEAMIVEYVYDALVGEDRDHADQLLLHRKAPLKFWLKYYFYKALSRLHFAKDEVHKLFNEPVPLTPVHP